jgi:predicted glycosyl hydrolase (DUF1957 family)
MKWINFLHLYQPVNIDAYAIKEAADLSYRRIVRALEKNPRSKFTLNVTGCLLVRLDELGYGALIGKMADLIVQGRVELTGTAAYHPLLPLLPENEVKKQVRENEEIIRKYFGDYRPRGFYLPEMAYGPEAAKIIRGLGYEWIILDEISATGSLDETDTGLVYEDSRSGLAVVFRSRRLSKTYVPETLNNQLDRGETDGVFLTGTDGELYGLRHLDQSGQFERLLGREELETITVSEFIGSGIERKSTGLVPSNWDSTSAELEAGLPYALWRNPDNEIQEKLWQMAYIAYEAVEENRDDANYDWARWHLVRGLASCTFWWASGKDFSHAFGPLAWSPDDIERGLNEMIRAVRSLSKEHTRETKLSSEKLFVEIKHMIWEKHWSYYWKK